MSGTARPRRAPVNTARRMARVAQSYIEHVLYWQAVTRLFTTIRWQLQGRTHHAEKQRVQDAFETIYDVMIAKELEGWRNAAIFGLTLPPEQSADLRQLVFARFFREPYQIMHHLAEDHELPPGYLAVKERIFREMLTSAFSVTDAQWRETWERAKAEDPAYVHPAACRDQRAIHEGAQWRDAFDQVQTFLEDVGAWQVRPKDDTPEAARSAVIRNIGALLDRARDAELALERARDAEATHD